jgi:hypothetical protein
MTGAGIKRNVLRFAGDEAGAAMVEFAMVVGVFFFIFFQIINFGIFASNHLMAEKSTQIATRIATVRPAACSGVPDRYARGTASPAPRFGTSCGAVPNACAIPVTTSCDGSDSNATASEIWARIGPTLPGGTKISDLKFIYAADPNLGYLGGPYVPRVTVELNLPAFQLFTTGQPQYRVFSITSPGEDLAAGING